MELFELFTVTNTEYEAIHSSWAKAVKSCRILWCISRIGLVRNLQTRATDKDDMSFYPAIFKKHFNERRSWITHASCSYQNNQRANENAEQFFVALSWNIIPKENKDTSVKFLETVDSLNG